MAKTLSFTDTSARTVKIGDTTTSFTLICGNDNVATDLTNVTSITVKLGNDSGYLKLTTIDPTSLTDPTTGQVTVTFTADLMTGLTAGSYALEVWVVDSAGTSIYPSDGSTGFTITNNIQSTNGSTITTITFDDFVKEMHKAASTIAKGDPGEGLDIKGQVTSVSALPATANEGDGYLVNEELYVYTSGAWKDCGTIQGPQGIQGKTGTGISSTTIQYQISNSATTAPTGTWSNDIVATTTANPYLWMKATLNYTDNTTKDFYLISQKGDKGDTGATGTVDNAGLTTAPAFVALQTQVNNSAVGTNLLTGTSRALRTWSGNSWSSGNLSSTSISLISGQTYTARMWIQGYDVPTQLVMRAYSSTGSQLAYATGNVIDANSSGYSTVTWTADSNWTNTVIATLSFKSPQSATHSGQYSELKLEKGSVATDWSLNPTEVLTQSDYAKIKAAIVALGGSLS